jgi:hypothetical protein
VKEARDIIVLHKSLLLFLKVIPMLLALTAITNTFLSYFGIDLVILSYIGGVSILPLAFLYLASYVFRFCEYHRMFLHYVTLNWILNIIDYYIGIPVSNKSLFLLYMVMTGVFIFLILYFHQKEKKLNCKGYS